MSRPDRKESMFSNHPQRRDTSRISPMDDGKPRITLTSIKETVKQLYHQKKEEVARAKKKVELQKLLQYSSQGMQGGSSPKKMAQKAAIELQAKRRKSKLDTTKLLGVGVTAPHENYIMKFTSLSPRKSPKNRTGDNFQETILRKQATQKEHKKEIVVKPIPEVPGALRDSGHGLSQEDTNTEKRKKPKMQSRKSFYTDRLEEFAFGKKSMNDAMGMMPSHDYDISTAQRHHGKRHGMGGSSCNSCGRNKSVHQNDYSKSQMTHYHQHRNQKNFLNSVNDSFENVIQKVTQGFEDMGYDFTDFENPKMRVKVIDTKLLMRLVEKTFNLSMTQFQATQAILQSNALTKATNAKQAMKEMAGTEASSYLKLTVENFDLIKFGKWLSSNIKILHKKGHTKFTLPSVSAKKKLEQFHDLKGGIKPPNILYLDEQSLPESPATNLNRPSMDKGVLDFSVMVSPENAWQQRNRQGQMFSNYQESPVKTIGDESSMTLRKPVHQGYQGTNSKEHPRHLKNLRTIDLTSGDPFYLIKQEQIEDYENKKELDRQIDDIIKSMKKFPKLRQSVLSTIQTNQDMKFMSSAQQGAMGSENSRMHLLEYKRKQRDKERDLLQQFIKTEPSACVANHLSVLLEKKWVEEPNAYKLMSRIDDKRDMRIKDIIQSSRANSSMI